MNTRHVCVQRYEQGSNASPVGWFLNPSWTRVCHAICVYIHVMHASTVLSIPIYHTELYFMPEISPPPPPLSAHLRTPAASMLQRLHKYRAGSPENSLVRSFHSVPMGPVLEYGVGGFRTKGVDGGRHRRTQCLGDRASFEQGRGQYDVTRFLSDFSSKSRIRHDNQPHTHTPSCTSGPHMLYSQCTCTVHPREEITM